MNSYSHTNYVFRETDLPFRRPAYCWSLTGYRLDHVVLQAANMADHRVARFHFVTRLERGENRQVFNVILLLAVKMARHAKKPRIQAHHRDHLDENGVARRLRNRPMQQIVQFAVLDLGMRADL